MVSRRVPAWHFLFAVLIWVAEAQAPLPSASDSDRRLSSAIPLRRISLGPVADNSIFSPMYGDTDNSAGKASAIYAGQSGPAVTSIKRGLIQFDLSRIPPGSTVISARLQMFVDRSAQQDPVSFSLHRVLKSWGEGASVADGGLGALPEPGDATWNYAKYPTVPWDSEGGDFNDVVSATADVGDSDETVQWAGDQLTRDVQAWVDGAQPNYGWMLLGPEGSQYYGSAKRFASREYEEPELAPQLHLEYTEVVAEDATACCLRDRDCTVLAPSKCREMFGLPVESVASCDDANTCQMECTNMTELGPCSAGACCSNDESCSIMSMEACVAVGGEFQGPASRCLAGQCSIVLEPFVDALPIPALARPEWGRTGWQAVYTIRMEEVKHKMHRDLPATTVWAYEGTFPGPTIETWSNVPIRVRWINNLTDIETGELRKTHVLTVDECIMGPKEFGSRPMTVPHVHGGVIPARHDGHPDFQFPPGSEDTYEFPNEQRASLLWYHDHGLGITRLNVYMGLAGAYVVRDFEETVLKLPSGKYEVPLIIADRDFYRDGSLRYPDVWRGQFAGRFITVNGKVLPYLNVERKPYRLRILNACNSRILRLRLSRGHFNVVGNERGLLSRRSRTSYLQLAPAERIDVVVVFRDYASGTEITLLNDHGPDHQQTYINPPEPVMLFKLEGKRKQFQAPLNLVPFEPLTLGQSVMNRSFVLQEVTDNSCGGKRFVINDLSWEDVTELPLKSTVELWSFINMDSIHIHPMHLHMAEFQIVDRQSIRIKQHGGYELVGSPRDPYTSELGWKDTVHCEPLTVTRVLVQFAEYTGRFAYHCHVLEHEDRDMMRQFWVTHNPGDCVEDGVCAKNEDCMSCPADCGVSAGSICGNSVCEAGDGENCVTCPQDCLGTKEDDTCCGFGAMFDGSINHGMTEVGCDPERCSDDQVRCRERPRIRACCGDSVCWGQETPSNCPVDCEDSEFADF